MSKSLLLITSIIVFILVLSLIRNKRYVLKLKKLDESRPKLTRHEYIDSFVAKGFDKRHVEVLYDELRDWIGRDSFSIYPEDDLHKVYEIDDLDDVGLIDEVCEKLNLRKADQADLDEINSRMEIFNAEYVLSLTKNLAS